MCCLHHLTTQAVLMVSRESYIILVEVKWIPLKAGNVLILFVMLCVGRRPGRVEGKNEDVSFEILSSSSRCF